MFDNNGVMRLFSGLSKEAQAGWANAVLFSQALEMRCGEVYGLNSGVIAVRIIGHHLSSVGLFGLWINSSRFQNELLKTPADSDLDIAIAECEICLDTMRLPNVGNTEFGLTESEFMLFKSICESCLFTELRRVLSMAIKLSGEDDRKNSLSSLKDIIAESAGGQR